MVPIVFTLNMLAALVILVSIAWRLAILDRAAGCKHLEIDCWLCSCVRSCLWIAWHVLIGVGAFGTLVSPLYGSAQFRWPQVAINLGLALYFLVPWQRRETDPNALARRAHLTP